MTSNTTNRHTINCFPKWVYEKSVIAFFIAFILCAVVFGHPMSFTFAVLSILSVLLFFLLGNKLHKSWNNSKTKTFEKRLYGVSVAIRFIWVLYCYFYFNFEYWGNSFGEAADVTWYMAFAKDITNWITKGFDEPFSIVMQRNCSAIDDVGYPVWLSVLYFIFGTDKDVFIPFVVKCLVSSLCPVFIYRIAKNHFGEDIARVSGIFVLLNPNLIFWCGSMFKEAEMVFITCWYLYEMDKVISSSKKLNAKGLVKALLIGMALLFFRSALGLVALVSVLVHLVFVSNKLVSKSKKILAVAFVIIFLLIGYSDSLMERVSDVQHAVESDDQMKNMEWRAKRAGGNSFAKYASAAVFAPLIFTIPFPTFNMANESQVLQMILSGGSFIKNIISFFVIFAMFFMLFSGEWRKHVFLIAFTCGYLAALTLSNFAQSGRFHIPVIPLLMMWGVYGISLVQKRKMWVKRFPLVLVVEVVICLGWNWFKLKGRGMI